jgi:hypothetical protein
MTTTSAASVRSSTPDSDLDAVKVAVQAPRRRACVESRRWPDDPAYVAQPVPSACHHRRGVHPTSCCQSRLRWAWSL